jgi:hypothetical protein
LFIRRWLLYFSVLNQDFQDFQDFIERRWWGGVVLMEMNTLYVFFAAAIIASAKSPEMKASFNNTLPS